MKRPPDWQALERQAIDQLPTLKARLDQPTTARKKLGLLLRIAVMEDLLKSRQSR